MEVTDWQDFRDFGQGGLQFNWSSLQIVKDFRSWGGRGYRKVGLCMEEFEFGNSTSLGHETISELDGGLGSNWVLGSPLLGSNLGRSPGIEIRVTGERSG